MHLRASLDSAGSEPYRQYLPGAFTQESTSKNFKWGSEKEQNSEQGQDGVQAALPLGYSSRGNHGDRDAVWSHCWVLMGDARLRSGARPCLLHQRPAVQQQLLMYYRTIVEKACVKTNVIMRQQCPS